MSIISERLLDVKEDTGLTNKIMELTVGDFDSFLDYTRT